MLDRNRANLLIDFYGSLLTEHQLSILKDYFEDDLSMNEIAENENISKSAVSDLIKRTLKQLEDYEFKLNLISIDEKLDKIIVELNSGDENLRAIANKLNRIRR